MVTELAKLLTRHDAPDPDALAHAWAEQLPHVGAYYQDKVVHALAGFRRDPEQELGNQDALRPVFDSRALEHIAANTEALQEFLKNTLDNVSAALRDAGIEIQGSVWGSVLMPGCHNVVYNTVLPHYPDLKHSIYDFSDTAGAGARGPARPAPRGGLQPPLRYRAHPGHQRARRSPGGHGPFGRGEAGPVLRGPHHRPRAAGRRLPPRRRTPPGTR
ncbi:MAG: hypothetical protein Q9O62_06985 [Ardenticatenia bacterium]|nr:hypothetical protein [Ardenticatenia bacterium]